MVINGNYTSMTDEKLIDQIKQIYVNIRSKFMPPRENPRTVENWRIWLNRVYPPGPWIPIIGFMATITSVPGANNTATYNPAVGYPLKSFVNTVTGEVKSFDARKFYM